MLEIFNFAFGPIRKSMNVYLTEMQSGDIAGRVYAQPDRLANTPPPEIKALTPWRVSPHAKEAEVP